MWRGFWTPLTCSGQDSSRELLTNAVSLLGDRFPARSKIVMAGQSRSIAHPNRSCHNNFRLEN